jgi:hypothetical protein
MATSLFAQWEAETDTGDDLLQRSVALVQERVEQWQARTIGTVQRPQLAPMSALLLSPGNALQPMSGGASTTPATGMSLLLAPETAQSTLNAPLGLREQQLPPFLRWYGQVEEAMEQEQEQRYR